MDLKFSKAQWIESAVLAPVSIGLSSALPFGIVMCFILLASGFVLPATSTEARLDAARPILALFAMMLGAAIGLGSLWLAVLFGSDWARTGTRRRMALLLGLALGLIAVAYWFSQLASPPLDAGSRKALLAWSALLGGPSVVAGKYMFILMMPRKG